MSYIKRVWLMGAYRDKDDHIWTDEWTFEKEIDYRLKNQIRADQDRDFVKKEE